MKKIARTLLIVLGLLLMYVMYALALADLELGRGWYWFLEGVGMGAILWGCYLWTSLKNRAWGFVFWGLLAPIGLLGIAVLSDKSNKSGVR
jgi:hypothetical protein